MCWSLNTSWWRKKENISFTKKITKICWKNGSNGVGYCCARNEKRSKSKLKTSYLKQRLIREMKKMTHILKNKDCYLSKKNHVWKKKLPIFVKRKMLAKKNQPGRKKWIIFDKYMKKKIEKKNWKLRNRNENWKEKWSKK